MADQIAISIAETQVNAGSAVIATVNFRTRSSAAASVPTSIRYRVDCLTNHRQVIADTSVSAASSVSITIPGPNNGTIDDDRDFETRQLTVIADYGLDTQVKAAATWRVRNIRTFIPGHVFQDDFRLEPYYPITAAETAAGLDEDDLATGHPPGDVRRYGAVGDGVTDDTEAFLAALSVADAFVPLGTYKITSRLPLKKYGLIGQVSSYSGSVETSKLIFYNQTDAALGSIYTDYDNWNRRALPIKNLFIGASSWDGSTGALGYGIDVTAQVDMDNVAVMWFGKSGVFLHNTDTDGEAPYGSVLKNVIAHYNGNHGILVGTGANVVKIIQPDCKYNGAPSYQTAPSVAGSYDGIHVDFQNDGNPGSAYFSYWTEQVSLEGGDCSYNSRYGWNLTALRESFLSPGYAEGNLQASPGEVRLGASLQNCFIVLQSILGGTSGVSFATTVLNNNRIFVGGLDCGAGNTGTIQQFTIANKLAYIAHDSTAANAAYLLGDPTTGLATFNAVGTGAWNLRNIIGISSTSTLAQNLCGQATFASAASVEVVFGTAEASSAFRITLSGNVNETFWVTDKGTGGFTINSSNATSTAVVDWHLIR